MENVPSTEELMNLEIPEGVPSAEELMALEVGEPEEEVKPGPGIGETILEQLSKVQAAVPAGLLPIAAKGPRGIVEAPMAAVEQYLAPPEEAPSMRQVMQVAGIPETKIPVPLVEPSLPAPYAGIPEEIETGIPASEAAGVLAEQVLDPLNIAGPAAAKTLQAMVPATQIMAKTGYALGKGAGGLGARAAGGAVGLFAKPIEEGTLTRAGEFAAKAGKGFEKGVQTVEKSVASLPQKAKEVFGSLKPTIRNKFIDHYTLATEVGIDADLLADNPRLLYGPDAFVSRAKAAQFDVTPAQSADKWEKLQQQLNQAVERQISNTSSGLITGSDPTKVGTIIRNSYDARVSDLFNKEVGATYSRIPSQLGTNTLDQKAATDLYNRLSALKAEQERALKLTPTTPGEEAANENLKAINKVMANIFEKQKEPESFLGQMIRVVSGKPAPTKLVFAGDLTQAIDQLKFIGAQAFSSPNRFGTKMTPSDLKKHYSLLKGLYGDLQDVIYKTVEKESPDLLKELKDSNKKLSSFFEKSQKIAKEITNEDLSPESVYRSLFSQGDSEKLKAFKELLGGTDAFNAVKGQILYDQISETADKGLRYGTIVQNLNSDKFKNFSDIIFSGEAGSQKQVDNIKRIIDLGRDLGAKEFNTSRSGVLLKIGEYVQKPIQALVARAQGDTLLDYLEKGAYQQYFLDQPLNNLLELRMRGGFNERFLDEVIAERLKDPRIVNEIQEALKKNKIPPTLEKVALSAGKEATSEKIYSSVRDALSNSSMLLGMDPGSGKLMVTRVLDTVSRIQKEDPLGERPVFIPEEDREAVKAAISESGMTSIQKAKNLRNLNTSGYLLEIKGFSQEPEESVIKKILKKNALKEMPKKNLEVDRPDILKALEEKAAK